MSTSLLRKAINLVTGQPKSNDLARGKGKGAYGTVGSYVPAIPGQYGQPQQQQLSDPSGNTITPARMREIVMKSPTAAACLNASLDYLVSTEIKIRNVDPAIDADPEQVKHVKSFLNKPNGMDSKLHFKYKVMRDLFTLGMASVEIEPNTTGGVFGLNPIDTGRLYIDYNEAGQTLGYDMVDAMGVPKTRADGTHAWTPDELLFFAANPSTDSGYSTSKVSQLYAPALIENLMLHFIGSRFTDSNVPYGLLDLGELSEQELIRAQESWNDQATSAHQILLTGSGKGGSKWMPFAYALKDLQASELIKEIQSMIMGICGVTKNETGDSQEISKSGGYSLSYTFKRRAIEPVLNEFCGTMTRHFLWRTLGYEDLELYYEEIDSRDQLLQAQIDKIYLDAGIWSINYVRNRQGEPNVPGGEEAKIILATGAIPVSLIDQFAQTQLALLQTIEGQPNADGSPGPAGKVSPPIIRPAQQPVKFGTPDGAGSSTAKVSLNPPGQSRGPVQANRNAGNRNAGKND